MNYFCIENEKKLLTNSQKCGIIIKNEIFERRYSNDEYKRKRLDKG